MTAKKDITIDSASLEGLQARLKGLLEELPEDQRGALEVILARAASSEAPPEIVNGFLDAARTKRPETAIAVLARALDGRSNVPVPESSLWYYNIWTHHHK